MCSWFHVVKVWWSGCNTTMAIRYSLFCDDIVTLESSPPSIFVFIFHHVLSAMEPRPWLHNRLCPDAQSFFFPGAFLRPNIVACVATSCLPCRGNLIHFRAHHYFRYYFWRACLKPRFFFFSNTFFCIFLFTGMSFRDIFFVYERVYIWSPSFCSFAILLLILRLCLGYPNGLGFRHGI